MAIVVSAQGDGPGTEAAPEDVTLREPLPVEIHDGRPFCPHCNENLSEGGAVRVPRFEYADLVVRDGKVAGSYKVDYEPSVEGNAQCAVCHGELAGSGGWDW